MDQLLHVVCAMIVLAPVLLMHDLYGATISGFLVGLVREMTEVSRLTTSVAGRVVGSVTTIGSLVDLFFWAMGGLAAGLLFL